MTLGNRFAGLPRQTVHRAVIALTAGAALALTSATTFAQVILLPNATTYSQDFNSLGLVTQPWVDGTTLAGWYAGINANNTPDGNLRVTDGTEATPLSGLLNLGAAGDADRALGSKATSNGNFANIAYGVLFQNNSGQDLLITNVTYTGELWRTNTGGNAEQWVTSYKVSPSLFTDVEPGGNSATANLGTFTAAPGSLNWTSPTNTPTGTALNGNDPANRATVTGDLNQVLLPGEYFMFRWVDTNLAGTDGYQGIEDLSITFAAVPEPGTLALLGIGLLPLAGALARKRRAAAAA